MILKCDNCQKKYKIDSTLMNSGRKKLKCRRCGHPIILNNPIIEEIEPEIETNGFSPGEDEDEFTPTVILEKPPVPEINLELEATVIHDIGKRMELPKTSKRFGLLGKMLIFFFLFPMALFFFASYFSINKLNELIALTDNESTIIVTRMAEKIVEEKALSVSTQCRLYLLSHPKLKREEFKKDIEFKKTAIQKFGQTGYTYIYSIPDINGFSGSWLQPGAKVASVNLPDTMKESLGSSYEQWWGIYQNAFKGRKSQGYYTWQDSDGSYKKKYMVCVPIEGTPFVVAATSYVDEISRNVKKLQMRATKLAGRTKSVLIYVFISILVIISISVSSYGFALTNKIRLLTDVANRISIGDLDAMIEIKSKDEIGDLSEAIGRMQESVRLSIDKLRKRRFG